MRDADFLHTLTPAESDALEDMGEPGTYAPGAVIFAAQGAGGDEIVLAERGPGELLGDLSGIDGLIDNPRTAISRLELLSRRLGEAEARLAR